MRLTVSARARHHLGDRALVLRAAHRNGCCGGSSDVPVAEVGTPGDVADFEHVRVGDLDAYVDRRLGAASGWVVDLDRLWRWSRLRVEPDDDQAST
ncbi:CC/Se motif family (seleno)protein [Rhabdothermincola salaria]|uniref:CC/Se motif family (seleno)protein n=1 Tax=Rhabdothermincola salaria TaxID=2903142 RepID=UPI001E323B3F|nr:CC/Se motif family (seleno)protein [Rhabdothermincola salaria]MCD9625708.1 hypothetical protein [Rhabdothermincola salaria]